MQDESKILVNTYKNVSAAYSMAVNDYVVRCTCNGTSGPYTLTLPPVADAKKHLYSIVARVADGTNIVTVAHNGDSESPPTVSLAANGAKALLYSDGLTWHYLNA